LPDEHSLVPVRDINHKGTKDTNSIYILCLGAFVVGNCLVI
jgi:hypothetical protein